LLLQHGADPNGSDPDQIAYTPLCLAARRAGSVDCVKLLLDYGADPDHAWGLCTPGRDAIKAQGGEMQRLLDEADRHPERRRLTPESVRRRLVSHVGWNVIDPTPHPIAGRTVWVFGPLKGPSLAWNWKWGIVREGKVRWQPDYQAAALKLAGPGFPPRA